MGNKYSGVSVTGYNPSGVPDDGSKTNANRGKFSDVYSNLTNPLNDAFTDIDSALSASFLGDFVADEKVTVNTDATIKALNVGVLVATGSTTLQTVNVEVVSAGTYVGLPTTSTNQSGLIEIATAAEIAAGTANDKAITPEGLAGASLGGVELITSGVIATATSIDISLPTSGYRSFELRLDGMELSGAPSLRLRLGNGSADATAAYSYRAFRYLGAFTINDEINQGSIAVSTTVTSDAARPLSSSIDIFNSADAGVYTRVHFHTSHRGASGSPTIEDFHGSGLAAAAAQDDVLQVLISGGTQIVSGNYALYGYKAI